MYIEKVLRPVFLILFVFFFDLDKMCFLKPTPLQYAIVRLKVYFYREFLKLYDKLNIIRGS